MYKIPANTVFIGKNLVFVPECHSTNTLALEISNLPTFIDGTVVVTNNQQAGRGQRGNTWISEPGKNLTLSIILKPVFLLVKDQFFLNIITSLAIRDVLVDKSGATVQIKWPNDILIGERKICGILVENQIQGLQVSKTVVGIGLNVNQAQFTIPKATSLLVETRADFELESMLHDVLARFEFYYFQLKNGYRQRLKEEYLASLYRKHEMHVFRAGTDIIQGSIAGIDEIGRLQLDTVDGVRSYGFKEIAYLP
ncbi:MAG TPA: biotin--[acetyl-CoA-carboxylase] ligase [Chryseosolibacter sp.]|nr:biotin--[acetyl-CoA-carboxylase] ligase [Chryseosolibacter sp.]